MDYSRNELDELLGRLREALTGCKTALSRLRATPATGLLLFASADEVHAVAPPFPVARDAYRCGPGFEVGVLEELLEADDAPWFAFIVSDGQSALVARAHGGDETRRSKKAGNSGSRSSETVIEARLSTDNQGRTRRGGMSAPRIGRIRDEKELAFAQKVAAAAAHAFLRDGRLPTPAEGGVHGLVLAGPAASKMVVRDALPPPLRAAIIAVVDTKAGGSRGLNEAVGSTADVRRLARNAAARAAVGEFFSRLDAPLGSRDASCVAFGPKHVAAAITAGAVATLIVGEAEVHRWSVAEDEAGYVTLVEQNAKRAHGGAGGAGQGSTRAANKPSARSTTKTSRRKKGKRGRSSPTSAAAQIPAADGELRASAAPWYPPGTTPPANDETDADADASSSATEGNSTGSDDESATASSASSEEREAAVPAVPFEAWLAEVVSTGAVDAVVMVADETDQTARFCRGFGGIGALLRFPFSYIEPLEGDARAGEERAPRRGE